jgi:hypothetical protein
MTRCSSSTLALDRLKVPSCNQVSTGNFGGGAHLLRLAGTCLLLCQLSCTLVLAVSEEFDNAALVRGETVGGNCQPLRPKFGCRCFDRWSADGEKREKKTYPATSLTTSRTKEVRWLERPFRERRFDAMRVARGWPTWN